jgi:serine phosphatase RsbU (regulator of sigma subunit)
MFAVVAKAGSGGSWWGASLAAALPAAGLAAAAGAVGLGSGGGLGLIGASAGYLALDLLVLQPSIDRRLAGAAETPGAIARTFLQRALAVRTVADVALELDGAARRALGVERALLIVPSAEGGVRVLGGEGGEAARVGDAEQAFLWLGDRGEPVTRATLAELGEFEGARACKALLDRLDGEVILPMRHRGLLLGVCVLSAPTNIVDLAQLATFYRTLGAHATVAIANTYLDLEARGKGSLSRVMDLATAVQEALMPEDRAVKRSGVSLRGVFRPVADCGGDLWTYQELGNGKVLLLIADATGHGAAPAMLTAVAKGGVDAMRHVAGESLDPAQLLGALNRSIYRAGRTRYMMTAFAAVLDTKAWTVTYANAGQNFPYVIAKGENGRAKIEALVARGNTLGAAPEAPYQSQQRRLAPGERLVLYTDGIIDAGAPGMEPFGEKRFRAVLATNTDTPAARLPEAIFAEMDGYVAGRPLGDDVTLVCAEILSEEEMSRARTGGESSSMIGLQSFLGGGSDPGKRRGS